MSAPTPRTDRQAAVLLGKTWVASYDEMQEHARKLESELATERAKVRTLRAACESICEAWGKSHDTPFYAGSEMEKRATAALAATEDAT